MTRKIFQEASCDLNDFITWRSFDGHPFKGWHDALAEEEEAYWEALIASEPPEDPIIYSEADAEFIEWMFRNDRLRSLR